MAAAAEEAGATAEVQEAKPLVLRSLYEVQESNGVASSSCSRVCYAATLAAGTAGRKVSDWHAAAVEAGSTGIALVQEGSVVGVVESSSEGVTAFLRALAAYDAVGEASVLALSEDCPARAFAEHRTATGIKMEHADFDLVEDAVVNASFALYASLLAVGRKLKADRMSAADKAAAYANLKNYCGPGQGDLVPAGDTVVGFATSEHTQSLADCLALYDSPINVKLGSELVWPVPQVLTLR